MPLSNPWWESDPRQRFWIEITNREDLGEDLLSPKVGRGGRPTPGYESMVHVRAGDIVFHYWQQSGQEPAIVSFSQVIGPAVTSSITWRPHGKNAGQMKPLKSMAWQVPLGGMTDLSRVVTLSDLRRNSNSLSSIASNLSSAHGKPIYFPFAWYQGELRAMQAYLTKFPLEIITLFPELEVFAPAAVAVDKPSPKDAEPRTKLAGYIADPKVRKAIELQAMRQADELLQNLGYVTKDVSSNSPYDIHATRGEEQIAVEVKGSSGIATTVELTIGEVKKAGEPGIGAMLVVVDQIPVSDSATDLKTGKGRLRFWPDWELGLSSDRLQPIRFRYLLEPGSVRLPPLRRFVTGVHGN